MKNKNYIFNANLLENKLVFFAEVSDKPDMQAVVVEKREEKESGKDSLREQFDKGELKGEDLVQAATKVADDLVKDNQVEGVQKAEVLHNTLQAFAEELGIEMNSDTESLIKGAYDKYESAVSEAHSVYKERVADFEEDGYVEEDSVFDLFDEEDIEDADKEDGGKNTQEAYDNYKTAQKDLNSLIEKKDKINDKDKSASGKILETLAIDKKIAEQTALLVSLKAAIEDAINKDNNSAYENSGDLTKEFENVFDKKIIENKQEIALDKLSIEYPAVYLPKDFDVSNPECVENAITGIGGKLNTFDNIRVYLQRPDDISKPFENWEELKNALVTQLNGENDPFKLLENNSDKKDIFRDQINNAIRVKLAQEYKAKYDEIKNANAKYFTEEEVVKPAVVAKTTPETIVSKKDPVKDTISVPAAQKNVAASLTTEETLKTKKPSLSVDKPETIKTNPDLIINGIDLSKLEEGTSLKTCKDNGEKIQKALNMKEDKMETSIAIKNNPRLAKGQLGIQKIQQVLNTLKVTGADNKPLTPDGLAGTNTITALQKAMLTNKGKFIDAMAAPSIESENVNYANLVTLEN